MKWHNHLKKLWRFLISLNFDLICNPVPGGIKVLPGLFVAGLFLVIKSWTSVSAEEEWVNKVVY